MTKNLDAIYENGALRLLEPLELENGARVRVAVEIKNETNGDGNNGVAGGQEASGPKSPEEILAILQEIAAQSVDHGEVETGSRDHDKYLYGEAGDL